MKTVGECMSEARRARGLTVNQLAEKAQINAWSIYCYESDRCFPSLMTLWTLADTLQIGIDEYIGRTQKEDDV